MPDDLHPETTKKGIPNSVLNDIHKYGTNIIINGT